VIQNPERPKAVFDCVTFVQAAMSSRGPAARAFRLAETQAYELFVSQAVLDEVDEVLSRPKILAKFPAGALTQIGQFLIRLRQIATVVSNVPVSVRLERDPKDEAYLDLAVYAHANYLVTRDRDLLDLMQPATSGGVNLPAGLAIITPEEFLATFDPTAQSPTP
jgi:putative PIN family toxin of toxin-antitoxin system